VVGARLAPREAVVARVLRRESAGIYVLLFMSVDDGEEGAFEGQGAWGWVGAGLGEGFGCAGRGAGEGLQVCRKKRLPFE